MFKERLKNKVFYGWFVLVAALLIAAVGLSIRNSFSIFYAELLNEFSWSRAGIVGVFSLSSVVYGISSPAMGALVDRFGPRKILLFGAFLLSAGLLVISQANNIWMVYLSFGIIIAMAINSLGLTVHYGYLSNWFITRRGLAFGILMASVGVSFFVASLYQFLISSFSWRAAYAILAPITFCIIVPLAILFIRKTPQEMGLLPDGSTHNLVKEESRGVDSLIVDKVWAETDWTLTKAFRTYRFWLMFSANLCLSFALNLIVAHQPIYCQDRGFSAPFAASIFGLVGFTTIVGNLFSSISDRMGREATYALGIFGAIIGVCALMLANPLHSWLLYLYVIFWGTFTGTAAPTAPSALADIFAGKHFGAINGFCMLAFGIGGAIGPWLCGYIFDITNSYNLSFITAIVALGLACILLWLAAPSKVRLVAGKVNSSIDPVVYTMNIVYNSGFW